jgi:hypothetical protein
MCQLFGHGSKGIAGALLLSALFAGATCLATDGIANGTKFPTISVDRMHKADRLPQASKPTKVSPSANVPSGCDPAFSPVADPSRARIFARCIT